MRRDHRARGDEGIPTPNSEVATPATTRAPPAAVSSAPPTILTPPQNRSQPPSPVGSVSRIGLPEAYW